MLLALVPLTLLGLAHAFPTGMTVFPEGTLESLSPAVHAPNCALVVAYTDTFVGGAVYYDNDEILHLAADDPSTTDRNGIALPGDSRAMWGAYTIAGETATWDAQVPVNGTGAKFSFSHSSGGDQDCAITDEEERRYLKCAVPCNAA
jgi:hypothetical protein